MFGLASTLGSLTASPIKTTIDQAHRMARRRLEKAVRPARRIAARVFGTDPVDYLLPVDVNPVAVALAIEAKLHRTQADKAERVIHHRTDGRAVVAGDWLRRLGDCDVERGKGALNRIIADIRTRQRLHR